MPDDANILAAIVVAVMLALWWERSGAGGDHAPPIAASASPRTTAPGSAARPTLLSQAALASAGRAAFSGDGAPALHAAKLIPVGDHIAVIGVGEGDGSHASGGTLAIQYLDQTGTAFTKVGPMVAEQTGSFGTIDDSTSDHGPSYEGKIERAGDGVAVRYTGSVTPTIILRRVGEKLVPDRPLPAGC